MDERYDFQQQLEQDRRREEEERAWSKHWRETWERWARNEPNKVSRIQSLKRYTSI